MIDIGANCGWIAEEAMAKWPGISVVCVEGNPACAGMLASKNLNFHIALLSDSEKEVVFYQRNIQETSTGDSIYREDTPWYESVVKTVLPTKRLDDMGFDPADFLKLDVQGAELDVLRGGPDLTSKARWIQLEVPVDGVKPYNIGAPTRKEVMDYMNSIGFQVAQILEDVPHPISREIIQQDILFERK